MSGYLDSDKYWKWDLSHRKHKWQSLELRHSETGCEDGMRIELVQDRVQWWALILAVLNLTAMLVGIKGTSNTITLNQ
jgi:hypothetical protein